LPWSHDTFEIAVGHLDPGSAVEGWVDGFLLHGSRVGDNPPGEYPTIVFWERHRHPKAQGAHGSFQVTTLDGKNVLSNSFLLCALAPFMAIRRAPCDQLRRCTARWRRDRVVSREP
jgi:hypothetical protein